MKFPIKNRRKNGRLESFIKIFVFVLIMAGSLIFSKQVQASSPDTTIFNDTFETGTGNWAVNGNITTSNTLSHDGSYSLSLDTVGDVSKKFPMDGISGINSPNRDVIFYWHPNSSNVLTTYSILSLEEGVWTTTDKSIEMFWDGNQAYFNLYRYADSVRTSTVTSSSVTISNDTWHKIEIISNTTLTQIKVDDVAVQFSGSDSSTTLTNVYNLIRFSAAVSANEVKDYSDSSNSHGNTTYVSGNTIRYKKELIMPYDPSDPTISDTTLSFNLDKDNTLAGNFVVDVNGQRALTLSNNDISPSNSNPSYDWYSFPINKALLVNGTNSIVMYSEGGTTNTVIRIDKLATTPNRSARSADSGATWNYSALTAVGTVDGEYMVRLNYTFQHEYNIDDVSVSKENIVNTTDLFGKTFDALTGTVPSGTDEIQAIYQYMITRDSSYLVQAELGADSIQASYDSGNRDLFYVQEMALLANVDSNRIGLLNNLTNALWTYRVNQTTFLPYSGSVANNTTLIGDQPLDALSVANAFMIAYKTSNNQTYLEHAEAIINAIHTYMLNPTYGTIVTSAYTTTGAQNNIASRGDDELTNFIETSLFLYEISGNGVYLNWATDQADKYNLYAWDNINKVYYYRPDIHGYEMYVPSFSLALLHLYEYTNNQTYLNNAKDNFTTYMTKIKRNGLLVHYFGPDGKYGHEPGMLESDIPHIAALLFKYTSDSAYLDISDEYTSIVLNYYYPTNTTSIASDSFIKTSGSLLKYLDRQTFTTNIFSRFILPSSAVNISWAYGKDLYVKYRGIASAPMDVWFARDAVHLLNVSGSGSIKFDPGIKKVYITPQAGSVIGVQMLGNLSIAPSTGAVDVETSDSLIDVDYNNSVLAGMTVNSIDKQIDLNKNGITSLNITPSSGNLNITVNTWNTAGDYIKNWTEESTVSNATAIHTVGNLEANKYYNITVTDALPSTITGIDGTTCNVVDANAICKSNSSGELSFQYTGGYSTHTFNIQGNTDTVSTPVATPIAGDYNSIQSVTLAAVGSNYIQYDFSLIPATCSDGTSYGGPISIATPQTIYVRACNNNGNSSTGTFAYTIDLTIPLTPVATPSAGIFNTTQSVTLTASGSDLIRYSLTETPADCSAGTLYSDSTPIVISSTETIYVRACDLANNSSTGSFTYTIDTTPPETPTATPSAGSFNSTQSVTLSAVGSDYIMYDLSSLPADCSSGTSYSGPIDVSSSSTIYARACDNARNSSTQSFAYIIDSEAPSTAIASPVAGTYTTTQTVTLTADGSDSIRYSTTETPATCSDGTLYSNATPISIATSSTIYVRACDNIGNSSTQSFAYVISPVVISHSSSGGSSPLAMAQFKAAQQPITPAVTPKPSVPFTPIVLSRIIKLSNTRMWGDDVLALQTLLNTKGYDSGIPDGNFGPKTQAAVIAFQKANSLTPDGSVGPNTLKYLNGNQTTTTTTSLVTIQPTITRILKLSVPRMIGDDVKALQTYLNTKGYDVGTLDGVLGTKTRTAVIAFQTANGLTPDGLVGAKTREMMK